MRAQVRNLEKEKLIKSQMVATQSSRSREVKHRVKPSHSRCRTLHRLHVHRSRTPCRIVMSLSIVLPCHDCVRSWKNKR